MLLLLLFLHQAWIEDVSGSSSFIIRRSEDCPQVGYYFKQESSPHALPGCFMCFCQSNGTSFCWRRKDEKCDIKRRRLPRSPGFADIFFKDGTNSFPGKHADEDCTTYDLSFSDDCPSDNNEKNDNRKKSNRKAVIRKMDEVKTNSSIILANSTAPFPFGSLKPRKMVKKSIAAANKHQSLRQGKIPIKFKNKPRRNIPKIPMFIKKDISTRKSVKLDNKELDLINSIHQSVDPKQLTRKTVKRVFAALTKIMKNEIKSNNTNIINKIKKRLIENNSKSKSTLQIIAKHKKRVINTVTVMPNKETVKRRMKRDIIEFFNNTTTETSVINTTKTNGNATVLEENITESSTNTNLDCNDSSTVHISMLNKVYNVTEVLSSYYTSTLEALNDKRNVLTINASLNNKLGNLSSNGLSNNTLKEKQINEHTIERAGDIPFNKQIQNNASKDLLSVSDILSANNLKRKSLSRIKLLKDKKTKSDLGNRRLKIYTIARKNINKKGMNKNVRLPKKYNIKKIIYTTKGIDTYANITKAASNKIYELKHFIRNILTKHKNNTKTNIVKKKKYEVLRYMKRFFNKIFGKNRTKINVKDNTIFEKHQIIETLCESFGPCKIDARNRIQVKAKIDEMYNETIAILRYIQIIRRLLKLVDVPFNENSQQIGKKELKADLQKLNIILNTQYLDHNSSLPEIQMIQIECIKNNTNDFIKAVRKSAETLNEIVSLVTNNSKNGRVLRSTNQRIPLDRIKNLLLKYKLIQNTFMNKMYEMITKAELNQENKHSKEGKIHNSMSIETYSKNIVNKLRKLKKLATMLKPRRKRQTMIDNDGLEYLLMLMEYVLQQSQPLDVSSPRDGIDVLIDAIRSSPDIKLIKKRVLQNQLADIVLTQTTESIVVRDKNKSELINESDEVLVLDNNDEISAREDNFIDKKDTENEIVDMKQESPKYLHLDDNDDNIYDYNKKYYEAREILGDGETTTAVQLLTIKPNEMIKDYQEINKLQSFEVYNEIDNNAIANSITVSALKSNDIEKSVGIDTQSELRRSSDSLESVNKRSRLKWIKQNVDPETADFKMENITGTTLTRTSTAKNSVTTTNEPQVDISSITKELADEKYGRNKMEVEKVLFKKQMDLLNSLDYATEISEFDETSKDDAETFPSYFA